jgi:hypothetical protein
LLTIFLLLCSAARALLLIFFARFLAIFFKSVLLICVDLWQCAHQLSAASKSVRPAVPRRHRNCNMQPVTCYRESSADWGSMLLFPHGAHLWPRSPM